MHFVYIDCWHWNPLEIPGKPSNISQIGSDNGIQYPHFLYQRL